MSAVRLHEVIVPRHFDPSSAEAKVRVVVGRVQPQQTSALLRLLAEQFPLQGYALGHLKRVRRSVGVPGSTEGSADSPAGTSTSRNDDEATPTPAPDAPPLASTLHLLLCPEASLDSMPPSLLGQMQALTTCDVCRVPPLTRQEYEGMCSPSLTLSLALPLSFWVASFCLPCSVH